jgi:protein glucosyltransferase
MQVLFPLLLLGHEQVLDNQQEGQQQRSGSGTCAEDNLLLCDEALPIYTQIDRDLAPYKTNGITKAMIEDAFCAEGPGFRAQIVNGELYFAGETFSYESRAFSVKMMLYTVVAKFGTELPDLDFMVSIGDEPPVATRMKKTMAPILAMARTAKHKVLLFPDHTFWNWKEANTPPWEVISPRLAEGMVAVCLQWIPSPSFVVSLVYITFAFVCVAAKLPWDERVNKAFFRGAGTSSSRTELAQHLADEGTAPSDVQNFDVQIFGEPDKFGRIDANKAKVFTTLEGHCNYKYLLHLPGITYAARLKYLLLCNSTVVAPMLGISGSQKKGGWFEFYYSALEAGTHYIDSGSIANLSGTINALQADQENAELVARQGHAWALHSLSMPNIWCYWRRLLIEYGKRQKFRVVLHPDAVSFEDSIAAPAPSMFRCRGKEGGGGADMQFE